MTKFLVSDDNPKGSKLEDILHHLRKDIISRCGKIVDDTRVEANHVLANNISIMALLTEAIDLAEDSTQILKKSFGPSNPESPRIGEK